MPPLAVRFVREAPAPHARTLAVFGHGAAGGVPLALPAGDGRAAWEVWESDGPVLRGRTREAQWATDARLFFACAQLQETPQRPLEEAIAQAYRALESLTAAEGFPHLLKVWHYFARINEGQGDDERYKRFSIGRARGMTSTGLRPAATAIGWKSDAPLTVFVLAAREPGERIENPRQTSAYLYPRQYGPVPPSFARAALLPWGQLLVSGTAAVVGHESRHPHDTLAQLQEIGENLRALVDEAQARAGRPLVAQACKVFVRDPADADAVQTAIDRQLPPGCERLVVLGDICRRDLDVEVEALFGPA